MLLRSWLKRFSRKLVSGQGRRKPQPLLERLETRSLMSVTPVAVTFTATEQAAFSGTVATFTSTDADPQSAANYNAMIDWGGGTQTAGTIAPAAAGGFEVIGDHTFTDDGNQIVNVTINDALDATVGTAGSLATVNEQSLTLSANAIVATEGTAFSGSLGTFSDPGTSGDASEYAATIDWGDGQTSPATLSHLSGANFGLSGSHTYSDEGNYTATATVYESNSPGTLVSATFNATVADNDNFANTRMNVRATEGQMFSGVVSILLPTNPTADPNGFDTTIDWGDGTTTAGVITVNKNGWWEISGDHQYADEGIYRIKSTLSENDFNGPCFTSKTIAFVADADDLAGTGLALAATEGAAFSGAVATFSNAGYPGNPATDFTASIDWGDGTTDSGTISGSAGNFTISGSHTYLDEGTYTPVVTLSDEAPGTASATTSSLMVVADADALNGTGMNLAATEGSAFSGAVATFTNTGYPGNPAADFTATIDWGDGTTGTGTISGGGGNFTVGGSHTYLDEGTYTPVATLSDEAPGSAIASASSLMVVADADVLAGTGMSLAATEGSAFSGTVATFTNTGYPGNPAADFTATIDWGDGTTDTGTLSGGAGNFTVTGSHVYLDEGAYAPVVTLSDDAPGSAIATAASSMIVADADVLAGTGMSLSATEGSAFSGAVATFTNTGYPGNPATDFTATIDWGDGTTDTGTITGKGGSFTVAGSHTYLDEGAYTPVVTFGDEAPGSAIATAASSMIVADADNLTLNIITRGSVQEGQFLGGLAAIFNDTGYPTNDPADFSGTFDWGDGTTFTTGAGNVSITSDGAGHFTLSVAGHAYADEGDYIVVATLSDNTPGTDTVSATSTLTATEADALTPSATPVTITGTEGTSVSGAVATFTNTGYAANPSTDFTATIDWGDGTTDTGTVSGSAGNFTVSGSHTYAEDGSYTITSTIFDDAPGTASATATGTANIAEADLSVSPAAVLPAFTEGTTASGVMATIADPGSSDPASSFSATIAWGDGSTSSGTVTGSAGDYTVSGGHAYADEGTYSITVTATENNAVPAATATAAFTVNVAEGDFGTLTPKTLTPTEGQAFTGAVATFTDEGNPLQVAGDWTATIDWGDGTTAAGTVTGSTGGPFTINGSHTYADEGTFVVLASFADDAPSTLTATITSTAAVSDADVLIGTGMSSLTATEGSAFSGAVATFTNTGYAGNPSTDFTATIDWGDGTTDTGTVSGSGGNFTVAGSHTYLDEGTYSPVVTLSDDAPGSAVATAASSMTVADADALSGTGMSLTAAEGSAFSGAVATFTNTGYAGNPSTDFTATIDWGDGTTDTGMVSGSGGNFTVAGSHTYLDEGTYSPVVTLSDDAPGSAVATAASSMTVADADALSGTGMSLTAAEGSAFSGAVATFTNTGYVSNPSADFTATIDWGDGTTDTGTVSGSGGNFTVAGSHTYLDEGTYSPVVTLSDDAPGSAVATAASSMTVADADVLSGTGMSLAATEGTAFTGLVASFTSANVNTPATDFSAVIQWGDGATSTGTVGGSAGSFTVTGGHLFTDEGSFAISIELSEKAPGTESTTIAGTASVAEGDTFAVTVGPVTATPGAPFSGQVATFTDVSNPNVPTADLTATIDWGDGTISTGTISGSAGAFAVSGTHTYQTPTASQMKVTVSETAPGTATATSQAPVTIDAITALSNPIAGSGAALNGYEFTPLNNVAVATFTHAGSDPASDFTATINWGDGTTSTGSVALSAGVYTVTGSHNYTDEHAYSITIAVHDSADSSSQVLNASATILEELLPGGVRGTANERFVSELYRDILGRGVDANSLSYLNGELNGGMSRLVVAGQVLAGADAGELRGQIIQNAFQTFLHRSAEAAAVTYFGNLLAAGISVQQLDEMIISSNEYYTVRGGGTADGFTNAVYQDLLGRPVDASSKTSIEQFLAGGGARIRVVDAVIHSTEYDRIFIDDAFTTYLHRAADGAAISLFSNQLAAGASFNQITAEILGSNEYFSQVSS